jgi:hypothetical protein
VQAGKGAVCVLTDELMRSEENSFMSTISQSLFSEFSLHASHTPAVIEAEWLQSQNMMAVRSGAAPGGNVVPGYSDGQKTVIDYAKTGDKEIYRTAIDHVGGLTVNVNKSLEYLGGMSDHFEVGSRAFLQATEEPLIAKDEYVRDLLDLGDKILSLEGITPLTQSALSGIRRSIEGKNTEEKVAFIEEVFKNFPQQDFDIIDKYRKTDASQLRTDATVSYKVTRQLFMDNFHAAGLKDKLLTGFPEGDAPVWKAVYEKLDARFEDTFIDRAQSQRDFENQDGSNNEEVLLSLYDIKVSMSGFNAEREGIGLPKVDLGPMKKIIDNYAIHYA